MTEFEFIDRLREMFSGIGDGAITGIGDDCAVIPLEALGGGLNENSDFGVDDNRRESLVVTTDMLVEGVHFLRRAITPRQLGRKSLAVSLSDIAAMGARPVASFLSVALPADCRGEWALEFAKGYAEMSERHGVKPAGGDTTSSLGAIAVSVTVIGRAPSADIKYRSSAEAGDVVVVAGELGASAAGLEQILSQESGVRSQESANVGGKLDDETIRQLDDEANATQVSAPPTAPSGGADGFYEAGKPAALPHDRLITHDSSLMTFVATHNDPSPQVAEGQWLGGRTEVHAMMDLSDGLAGDLVHILRVSTSFREARRSDGTQLGAEIYLEKLPVPKGVSIEQAVGGGEDYKLLFTVASEGWPKLRDDFRKHFGTELYAIGRIIATNETTPKIVWLENGVPTPKEWHGFDHF